MGGEENIKERGGERRGGSEGEVTNEMGEEGVPASREWGKTTGKRGEGVQGS